ncbi:hypothetical protein [Cryptosporangium minutisporangium]|uniref:Uncharacterized protein n=1 Tax=Cryptosporangium minutisporangium TaxID=113569 RepID=A0ABP6SQP9_9ACTN
MPLLVPASSWNPDDEGLDDWLEGYLRRTYPFVGDEAPGLLADRRILPVLDGLDEVAVAHRRRAYQAFEDAADRPILATLRSHEYSRLVRRGSPLTGVAVIRTQRVHVDDIVAILRGSNDGSAWEPVFAALRSRPSGALARTLSVPQTLALARTAYASPGSDPSELLDPALRRPADLEAHLLRRYLPAAYTPDPRSRAAGLIQWAPGRPVRWLQTLARLMDDVGTPEFVWWRLERAVPRLALVLLAAALGLLSAAPSLLLVPDGDGFAETFSGCLGAAAVVSFFWAAADLPNATGATSLLARSPGRALRRSFLFLASGLALLTTSWLAFGAEVVPTFGVAGFLATLFWSGPWGRWMLTRAILAVRGDLPFRLPAFLADAVRLGVLRTSGSSYRFSHYRLQELLVSSPTTDVHGTS